MSDINARLDSIFDDVPAVPVLTIDEPESAIPLGRALAGGGLNVVEVTLRTPAALGAIEAMRSVDGLVVGAGTVIDASDLHRAAEAGAAFAVSPGATDALYRAAAESGVPLLPGVATASDIMQGIGHGWKRFKFFPAEAAGGRAALRAFGGPFPSVRFCPTGGIASTDAPDYRRLTNVLTVGGSWMVPADAVSAGDWDRIEALARDCANLMADD
ncbi:MAG: bifunctional 4-hydroxy-2-oxoglutarate aldolase/2-dehydro-3-deoxy-phosphogluconate aldolase [Candidatus Wenzhouxiangella sp. M2_3B_020]